ncbi:MAG: class I tRNA ligase family protein, partial [Patescibacteria group bacterium]
DTIFGSTFVVVSPELAKFWLDIGWQAPEAVKKYVTKSLTERGSHEQNPDKGKTGIFSDISAINPANNKKIPVWISDYVLAGYGTGAIMAVPAHDERDMDFAKKFNLPISNTSLVSIEEGIKKSGGKKATQFRLRDWLISRQRYWGAPIPMIYCDKCARSTNSGQGWQPVPEKDLPVKLPYIKNFRPTGTDKSPLAADEKFCKVKCPKCGGTARRETDVADTFLDSAWYYLGYLMKSQISNLKSARQAGGSRKFNFDGGLVKKWCPVDMYIGGAEHSVLHLLYVRFLAMVFKDLRLTNFDEPFKKFRAHGLLIKDGAKMSKSKGNVVNPDEYIKNYGADALRMYLMFLGPFDQGGDFRDSGIKGITRFLERIWKISNSQFLISKQNPNSKIQKEVHKTIKKVTEDIENLSYNTAISALMILLNEFEASKSSIARSEWEVFVRLLAPFAPHMAEEIWQQLRGSTRKITRINAEKNRRVFASVQRGSAFESVHLAPWPEFDPRLVKDKEIDIVVQVNARMRAVIKLPVGASEKEVERAARSNSQVSKHFSGSIKRVVFVKDKFINFVI